MLLCLVLIGMKELLRRWLAELLSFSRRAEHLSHGYTQLAWALERIARMGYYHVVQHQDVSARPGKSHLDALVDVADTAHHRLFNGRAVAIVPMSGEVLLRKELRQRSASVGVKRSRMPVMCLGEPHHLA